MQLDAVRRRLCEESLHAPHGSDPEASYRLLDGVSEGELADTSDDVTPALRIPPQWFWIAMARKPVLRVLASGGQEKVLRQPEAVSGQAIVASERAVVYDLEEHRDVVDGWAIFWGLFRPRQTAKSSRLPTQVIVVVGQRHYLAPGGLRVVVEVDAKVRLCPLSWRLRTKVYSDYYELVDDFARSMLIQWVAGVCPLKALHRVDGACTKVVRGTMDRSGEVGG